MTAEQSEDAAHEALDRIYRAKRTSSFALSLHGLQITELPDPLRNLIKLTNLAFSRTQVAHLPTWLSELANLTHLVFYDSRVTELPYTLGDLNSLIHLDLSGTRASYLPASLGSLSNLMFLGFSRTRVTALPDSLENLTNLRYLVFNDAPVKEAPEWLGSMKSLSHLDLSGSRITYLPASLGNLSNLNTLSIHDTQISDLPDWIGALTNLTHLDLSRTEITELPPSLGNLTNLTTLITPDRLVVPPPEIARQSTRAVLAYLRSLQADQAPEEQWRCKLVIAGEAKAGKTSLVRALRREPHDPREPMTHGVKVLDLALPHPERSDIKMHLSTWDFGGQRTYRSAHRFYMTDQSLFLLVFNCREEWDDRQMREWLKAISARAGASPILLVGTHAREHRHGLPIATLRADFPQIAPTVFYIDCEPQPDRLGIDELRTAIARHASSLPLMGRRWPKTWLSAARAVVELLGDHTSVATVDTAMQHAGLDDPHSRASLLAALHYRGEILHFATEPEIADTVVLHPTWVDGHVTKILDSADVHHRHGLLSQTELKKAWPRTDPTLRSHLIGLMEAFDLAYRVDSPAHDDLCLVVDRLPHDPPDYHDAWHAAGVASGADELRLLIDFGGPVLLAGIPTWFIAREHRFTTNTHWRYGALLYDRFDSGCHALLIADDNRGVVELTVRGVAPVRFLSVLKDGLLSPLRQRYPYLKWTIRVPCPCQDGQPNPCDHLFDEDYLHKVAALERTTVECRRTLIEIPVERLLYGLRAAPLTQIAREIRTLDHKVGTVARMQEAALDFQRATTAIQQAQSESCPSVFTLRRHRRRVGIAIRYELRLFCEQPGGWHPLPGNRGVIAFNGKPAWLDSCAPYLRVLLPLLQHTLPVLGPALGAATNITGSHPASTPDYVTDLWSHEQLADELEAMRQLVDAIPGSLSGTTTPEAEAARMFADDERNPLRRAHDLADFRVLRRSLDALAAPGSDPWGGLTPMVTPEGIAVFVCEHHAGQYKYPRQT